MDTLLSFALDYGLFLAKTVTLVVAVALVVMILGSSIVAARREKQRRLKIERVNERLTRMGDVLSDAMESKSQAKARAKKRKAEAKARAKAKGDAARPARLFVLDFDGDIRASAVDNLRHAINALLQVVDTEDEVLLRLESGGGLVHSYGLAASQLERLKTAGVRLTVSVDQIAASGGYMMACVADRIVAAPFAIVGSIGVVAQVPNFHRWLDERHIDYELHTAGDYKRTLTLFGENTDAGRDKFRAELENTHGLFKTFVGTHRPQLDIDAVATGEHWYGREALARDLVDDIATSDDLMLTAAREHRDVYAISMPRATGLLARLAGQGSRALSRLWHDHTVARPRAQDPHV
ncbi:protease SohB [Salinisphaera sp. Q1T1-3]|uniref:protease SohB n=1 Tax=Salinisphaera sp. Q1T1-3 TaxID=2321229 RepID=UPI000E73525C|nr:protease SohB [Salinisphaera sp. Q1T1-3]RJS94677.1 protease SohB [Salinisphaera sp. Q1T1-3]